MEMNLYGRSLVVDEGMNIKCLDPVEATQEKWLQQILDKEPSLLPVELVDERLVAPLTSLGMEIGTDRGPIDVLAISSNGLPLIIETKLWRNHQARRTVVAQILDYAGQVRGWNYAKLDALAQARWSKSLFEAAASDEFREQDWIDRVARNLRKGRMSLIVAGDGIREEAAELTGLLNGHPDFEFRLGMVALRVHQLDETKRLIVPQVVARTAEIVRAIVEVRESAPGAAPTVVVAASEPAQGGGRNAFTESEYFESMAEAYGQDRVQTVRQILDNVHEPLFFFWKPKTIGVGAKWGGGDVSVELMSIPHRLDAYTYLPTLRGQLDQVFKHEEDREAFVVNLEKVYLEAGGRRTPQQLNIDPASLQGSVEAFVERLTELGKVLTTAD